MVVSAFVALITSLLYFYMTFLLWKRFTTKTYEEQDFSRQRLLSFAVIAATLHLVSFSDRLFEENTILFGFGLSLSIIMWLSVVTLLITNITKSTENLGIFIFPIAGITVLLPFSNEQPHSLPIELGSHVLISIAAYSILGLAAAQAIIYSTQEKRFRQKKLSTLYKNLPPLQVMETILVQLVFFGFVLLSFALISGFFFMEDMFAQHLVHKTFFAMLSWLVYGIFLLGHIRLGWRGQTAARYTMWAYSLLLLSYIGTEIILSIVN